MRWLDYSTLSRIWTDGSQYCTTIGSKNDGTAIYRCRVVLLMTDHGAIAVIRQLTSWECCLDKHDLMSLLQPIGESCAMDDGRFMLTLELLGMYICKTAIYHNSSRTVPSHS